MKLEKNRPLVLVIMGSDSDLPVVGETAETLKKFAIPFKITVASAHRTPERVKKLAEEAQKKGIEVIIAAAGAAAHLAGVIASNTTLPVIGVPLNSSPLLGFDALLSTVQMPSGIPVATMSVGQGGAKNAAIFAARILSLKYPSLCRQLKEHLGNMSREVDKKAEKVERLYKQR